MHMPQTVPQTSCAWKLDVAAQRTVGHTALSHYFSTLSTLRG